MTEVEKAYIAGIVDGEGSIKIDSGFPKTRPQPKHKKLAWHRLILEVRMCHLPTIVKIQELTQVGTVHEQKVKAGHRPLWQWRANSNKALYVLENIYPYLVTKKLEAEVAIMFQRRKRNRGQIWHSHPPLNLIEADYKFKEVLHSLHKGEAPTLDFLNTAPYQLSQQSLNLG